MESWIASVQAGRTAAHCSTSANIDINACLPCCTAECCTTCAPRRVIAACLSNQLIDHRFLTSTCELLAEMPKAVGQVLFTPSTPVSKTCALPSYQAQVYVTQVDSLQTRFSCRFCACHSSHTCPSSPSITYKFESLTCKGYEQYSAQLTKASA